MFPNCDGGVPKICFKSQTSGARGGFNQQTSYIQWSYLTQWTIKPNYWVR